MSAPGYQDADVSFIRNDSYHERIKGQLRIEFFNIANHPNLGAPASSGFTAAGPTSTVGVITSTGGNPPRLVQYGYKITF